MNKYQDVKPFQKSFFTIISFLCFFFFLKIDFLNNLLVKNVFREKTSFYLLLIFLHYLHCFFLERDGGGKSCQFSTVKKMFCFSICFSWHEFHLFPLFISFFNCHFPVLFFSLGHGDQMADDKTRHHEKRVKPMVGMVTKV